MPGLAVTAITVEAHKVTNPRRSKLGASLSSRAMGSLPAARQSGRSRVSTKARMSSMSSAVIVNSGA
jgi:hypothetical protein